MGEDQGADPDTVTEDGTGDDEHAVGEEGEHQAPDEEEDGNPEKPHPDESDKSVADALANTAHRLCPMLRPLTGKRAQTVRSLITWIAFVLWRWHIENNVSQSALVPLLQLIVQVISVAGAHEINANLVAEVFPNTIFKLRKWFGMDDAGNFQKMVCCNKCYRIYPDDGSMRYRSNDRHRKLLTRPCYGAVVKQGRDTLCNEVLFDCKKTEKGTLVYTPKHIYCYQPLSKSLDNLLSRLGFLDKCNAWRRRRATRGVYSDIYDGSVWKRFVTNGFLREETSLALQLNLDWFQPFTRRNNISVGAIYLSILNLPREDRYKLENVILLGIIPNLTHEPNTLEYLLRPLVEELKIFYKDGIHLPKTDRLIKCVLICVTCDLPATRKVCGFLGHSAKLGCSRCLLDFGAGTTKNVGKGFNKKFWRPRTQHEHRQDVAEVLALEPRRRPAKEKERGVRYSPLLDLEYYHPIQFCAIDAMHNLFLGTAKTFMRLLLQHKDKRTREDLLNDDKMAIIDQRLSEFKQGLTDEWVVENMKSNMGTLTAAEWRHWTLVSSAYCLHGLIPAQYLQVWEHFVKGCRLLSPACIRDDVLDIVDAHFAKFGNGISGLFGSAAATPNMHMQMHLTSVVKEYGPLYASWLFAFERYNGVLGDINTNNRQIEGQIMARFLEAGLTDSLQDEVPKEYEGHFAPLLKSMKRVNRSVAETMHVPEALIRDCEDHWSNCTGMVTSPKTTVTGLHRDELQLLRQTYKAMYPSQAAVFDERYIFGDMYVKSYTLEYGPNLYASATKGVRTSKNGWIMARWFGANAPKPQS